ncbi:MAG: hypothetical protein ACRC92_18800 [Peptostreptococcaceae bacterium]
MKVNRIISSRSTMSFSAFLSMISTESLNTFIETCEDDMDTCERKYMDKARLSMAFGNTIHIDSISVNCDKVYFPKCSDIKSLIKFYVSASKTESGREKLKGYGKTFRIMLENHIHANELPKELLSEFYPEVITWLF